MTHYNYSIAQVLDIVSAEAGICQKAIKGPRRTLWISRHRQIVMFLCRRFTTKSTSQIARALGVEDHSTVAYAGRTVTKLIKENNDWRRLINLLEIRLKIGAPTILKADQERHTQPPEPPKQKKIMNRPSIRKPAAYFQEIDTRLQAKNRTCLGCGKEYLSAHAGDRKCPSCRQSQRKYGERSDSRYESATA